MRTPNADKLNASMRTSTRKRKVTTTIILSDDEADDDYHPVIAVESADEYDGKIEDHSDEELPAKPKSGKRSSTSRTKSGSVKRIKTDEKPLDIEDALPNWRPHTREYHDVDRIVGLVDELLQWFQGVRCVFRELFPRRK
jgi:hypothetical protein